MDTCKLSEIGVMKNRYDPNYDTLYRYLPYCVFINHENRQFFFTNRCYKLIGHPGDVWDEYPKIGETNRIMLYVDDYKEGWFGAKPFYTDKTYLSDVKELIDNYICMNDEDDVEKLLSIID